MKQIISIKCVSTLFIAILLLAGCSSPRGLVFADREWHISNYYGQIIDKDTTYRMTFGNVLIPDPLVIVSSADSVAKYPGMDRFIADVLHTCRLDSAEILFYASADADYVCETLRRYAADEAVFSFFTDG